MKEDKMPSGPYIPVLVHGKEGNDIAENICFGIEEEGIPFQVVAGGDQHLNGYVLAHQSSLGVAVEILSEEILLFSRLRKDDAPLLAYLLTPKSDSPDMAKADIANADIVKAEKAKAVGKNAARIVKGKPLLDIK
jgi:hypothetical protein